MKDILFFAIAGLAGIATFFLLARKLGSDCIP